MTDEEINNEEVSDVIETAVNEAVTSLQKLVEGLQEPPADPEKSTFEQNMENSINQYIEDEKTNRWGGKELEYKPGNKITGQGKDI